MVYCNVKGIVYLAVVENGSVILVSRPIHVSEHAKLNLITRIILYK